MIYATVVEEKRKYAIRREVEKRCVNVDVKLARYHVGASSDGNEETTVENSNY